MRALVSLPLLAACGPGFPEPADLHDTMWANVDAGTWRVFTFAESSAEIPDRTDTYEIWVYADGAEPTRVQAGAFALVDPTLVTEAILPTYQGQYGNEVLHYDRGLLTLSSDTAADGFRDYDRVEALP